jgi:hypothetical protein
MKKVLFVFFLFSIMPAQASLDGCVLKGELSPRSSALLYDIYARIAAVSSADGKNRHVSYLEIEDEERFAKTFLMSGAVTPRERDIKEQNLNLK